jgi:hypothetical protein
MSRLDEERWGRVRGTLTRTVHAGYQGAADLDGNGVVSVTDFTLFATVYNVPCP